MESRRLAIWNLKLVNKFILIPFTFNLRNYYKNITFIVAIVAYRKLGDVGMVNALENMVYLEDINVLSGFCCLLLERYDEAKRYFLKGVYSRNALDLCRDLLKWEQALLLAQKFEPNEVPLISREYAQQLEYK